MPIERDAASVHSRNGARMDLNEAQTHSFIIRVWLEETIQETGQAVWRGHITHLPDGERRYVEDLNGIVCFIASYLKRMGVRTTRHWRLTRWLNWWRR